MTLSTTFDELLNVFWLRPETAMWREIDISAMVPFKIRSPSLDLGCGDGIFSFIRAGGGLDEGFDAFRAVARLDRFFENADVFDAFDESVNPVVTHPPGYRIDCGFDHKENLLRKAKQLGLYSNLKVGDANHPYRLPTIASTAYSPISCIGLRILRWPLRRLDVSCVRKGKLA